MEKKRKYEIEYTLFGPQGKVIAVGQKVYQCDNAFHSKIRLKRYIKDEYPKVLMKGGKLVVDRLELVKDSMLKRMLNVFKKRNSLAI